MTNDPVEPYAPAQVEPARPQSSRVVMRTIALIANAVFVFIWIPAIFSVQLDQAFGGDSFGSLRSSSSSGGWIALSILLFVILLLPVMGFNLAYLIYWLRTKKRDSYMVFNKAATAFLIMVPSVTAAAVTLWVILSVLLVSAFNHSTGG